MTVNCINLWQIKGITQDTIEWALNMCTRCSYPTSKITNPDGDAFWIPMIPADPEVIDKIMRRISVHAYKVFGDCETTEIKGMIPIEVDMDQLKKSYIDWLSNKISATEKSIVNMKSELTSLMDD